MERLSFTRIKGLSDIRRIPRLGKLRLGVKMVSKTGNEYPKEVDHFVCPPEVEAVYGKEPKSLDVMLPVDDPEVVFPQKLAWYGRSRGPKCMGDGERAMRVNEQTGEFHERDCPCEKFGKECSRRAHLLVMLPHVSIGGVYQIDLGSYHSIVDINSGMDYVRALVGRISMVPLKLRRVARETHGSGKKEIHYTLQLILEGNIQALNYMRRETLMIPEGPTLTVEAEDINPKLDLGARVVPEPDQGPFSEEEQQGSGEVKNEPPEPAISNWKAAVNLLSKLKIGLKKMELFVGKKRTEWNDADIMLVKATAERLVGGEDFDQIIVDQLKDKAKQNTPEPLSPVTDQAEVLTWFNCPDGQERPETYCPECPTNMDCDRKGLAIDQCQEIGGVA